MVQAITMTVLIIAEVATTTTNLTTVATDMIVACYMRSLSARSESNTSLSSECIDTRVRSLFYIERLMVPEQRGHDQIPHTYKSAPSCARLGAHRAPA